ncbi:MAG: GAF domain-containing protein, partial [Geodermatophilaceae bacterium]|nr:GAF domain-containing protein [Geodermatophilaceae bacterium]
MTSTRATAGMSLPTSTPAPEGPPAAANRPDPPATAANTAERPAATLPLPNGLAYAIAAVAVTGLLILPFAVIRSGSTLAAAAGNYELNNVALAAALGALILWRRPGHVIGWVLVAAGGLNALVQLSLEYRQFGLPSGLAVEGLFNWLWVLTQACLAIALPQLFPDGRLLSRRWRPLAWFGALVTALAATLFIIDPAGTDLLFTLAFLVFGLACLASLVPLGVRFRRSRGAERQQFKWVFYGLAISLPVALVDSVSGTDVTATAALTLVPLVVIPVAITVAVLRYRLFDIDVVISRTLLVAGLAGFITAAYVGIVVGVGSLVGRGGEPDLVLSVAATAVVAVAFQPVRRGLQRVANRLVFGRRATPYDVLSGFATRVGAAEPSSDTLVQLAELMARGTGADPARVWLRVGAELRPAATWPPRSDVDATAAVELQNADGETLDRAGSGPALPDADLGVPVRDQGELLGMLTIAKPRGERVTEVDVELLGRLAAASGVVLRNLRLDAELAQRLTDLEASRRRLLSAQNDARQRIEA